MPPPTPPRTGSEVNMQLAELLTHTARRLRRGSVTELAPLGLTYAQARVLRLVAAEGGPCAWPTSPPSSTWSPGRSPPWSTPSKTAGLVVRHADPGDRRSVLVALSDEGRDLLDRLEAARRDSAEAVFGRPRPRPAPDELLGAARASCASTGACVSCCKPHVHGATGSRMHGHREDDR